MFVTNVMSLSLIRESTYTRTTTSLVHMTFTCRAAMIFLLEKMVVIVIILYYVKSSKIISIAFGLGGRQRLCLDGHAN